MYIDWELPKQKGAMVTAMHLNTKNIKTWCTHLAVRSHLTCIQLFQLRLSPSKAEKSNTSAKGCWELLINSFIY